MAKHFLILINTVDTIFSFLFSCNSLFQPWHLSCRLHFLNIFLCTHLCNKNEVNNFFLVLALTFWQTLILRVMAIIRVFHEAKRYCVKLTKGRQMTPFCSMFQDTSQEELRWEHVALKKNPPRSA
jgi:hypothetical protein